MKITWWRKRILVTRPRARAEAWVKPFAARGAEVVFLPTFALQNPPVPARRELVARLIGAGGIENGAPSGSRRVWLAFTSPTSAERFFDLVASTSREIDLSPFRVAAVGPATAEVLRTRGLDVETIAADASGDDSTSPGERLGRAILVADGADGVDRGDGADVRVWHVASDQARAELGETLREAGADCEPFTVTYHETLPLDLDRIERELLSTTSGGRGGFDVMTFGSPSAVRVLFAAVKPEQRERMVGIPCLAIGQTTAAALRDASVQDVWISKGPDVESIIATLDEHWGVVSR